MESELNIEMRYDKWYLNKKEPLFTLDILNAGNKDEIKAAMKKRFEEKCVPYIKKFVAAINKADVV